ncbi:hypothetical protein Taro_021660 [Colocasia esculenta]|uniref:BED-type domain-containing protein n=1 Tax=Colocasia esculenta TaxID=4460 RepID=A0A843V8V6_COLES|nr:hypothetical protein [Colocasia esculenta]
MASASENIDFGAENIDKGKKLRSLVWIHFERVTNEDGSVVAICHYCQKHLVGNSSSGTKHLNNHVIHCPEAQALKKSRGETEPIVGGGEFENPPFVFDNEKSREDFAKMVILHQYPFAMIEHAIFRPFLKNVQPELQLLSRNIVKSDCIKLYTKEKEKVLFSLESLSCRVSLTLDMWTSIGNDGYMCLTCHYIDNDWNLRKIFLNIEYVEAPHGHKVLTKNIHKKIFSIVLDNVSANNKAVKMLLNDPTFTQCLPLDGSWFHLRCSANILNLICQDGLKKVEKAARFEVGLKKFLILDVSTRWNSTYLMLERAAEFEKVFSCLQLYDSSYPYAHSVCNDSTSWSPAKDPRRLHRHPWIRRPERVAARPSGVPGGGPGDICIILVSLKQWSVHDESFISLMASPMLLKFDKYWRKTNTLLAIATILDPRFKMFMVRYFFENIYGDEAEEKIEEVKVGLQQPAKPEDDFDILKWWKSNSLKYLILSSMARDVLATPVTGSRVINKYRSSLDATTVQALICTENLLWDDVSSFDISEEDALSSIFASSKIIDENEDEILKVPYDDAFVGVRRVLIAETVETGDIVLWLPLFWLIVSMRTTCRVRDGCANVDRRIATGSRVTTWSQHGDTLRCQPSCIFKKPWKNRAFTSSARPGEVLLMGFLAIRARGPWLVVFLPRGSRVELEKRRVIARFGVLHQSREILPFSFVESLCVCRVMCLQL